MNMPLLSLKQQKQVKANHKWIQGWRLVERLLDKCISDGKYQQSMGMSIECSRLDKLEEAISRSDNIHGALSYSITLSHSFVNHREYRCEEDALLAFQIAFNLVENEHQSFLLNVVNQLSGFTSQAIDHVNPDKVSSTPNSQNGNASVDAEDVHMSEESHAANGIAENTTEVVTTRNERHTKIKGILSGETSIQLTLQFLYSQNRSDLLIMEMRNRVGHSATICANAIMHAGTTVDTFLRENLEWLSRATNWAKFSATAGLGVICSKEGP